MIFREVLAKCQKILIRVKGDKYVEEGKALYGAFHLLHSTKVQHIFSVRCHKSKHERTQPLASHKEG